MQQCKWLYEWTFFSLSPSFNNRKSRYTQSASLFIHEPMTASQAFHRIHRFNQTHTGASTRTADMYSVLEIIPQPESLCKVPRNELYITSSVRTGDLSEKQSRCMIKNTCFFAWFVLFNWDIESYYLNTTYIFCLPRR